MKASAPGEPVKPPTSPPYQTRPLPQEATGSYNRIAKWLAAGACSLPFALMAWFIYRYGVNLPFSDQWELVLLIRESRSSGVGVGDLFAQHGEQRMFVPRLIMLALAPLTNWNIRVELFINLLLAAGIFLLLVLLLMKSLRHLGKWRAVPAVILSLLVFSPVQWENWFWGWQISWYLPLFCMAVAAVVLGLWPKDRPVWPAMAVALAAALVGQYSLLSGTLIWITCSLILAVRKNFRKHLWIWIAAGGLSTFAYLSRWVSPPSMESFHMPPSLLFDDPKRPLAYLLYLLGRPVLDAEPRYWAGALFLGVFLASVTLLLFAGRGRLEIAAPWLAIASYALLSALLTTFGRLGIGLNFAGSSRYTTIGILFMISTLALATLAWSPEDDKQAEGGRRPPEQRPPGAGRRPALQTGAVMAAWVMTAALFLLDYSSEVETLKTWHEQRLQIKQCLVGARSPQDPCLSSAYPATDAVFERTQYLKSIGWGGFQARHPMR